MRIEIFIYDGGANNINARQTHTFLYLFQWSLKFARIVFMPQQMTKRRAVCATKFRQSTGSVLKSTGE